MSYRAKTDCNCCVCDKTISIDYPAMPSKELSVKARVLASIEAGWASPILCGDPACGAVLSGHLYYPSMAGVIGYARSLDLVIDENFRSRQMDTLLRAHFPYEEFFADYGWQHVSFPFIRFWQPEGGEAFMWFKDYKREFRRFEGWAFFLVQQQLRQCRGIYDIKTGATYEELERLNKTPNPIYVCDDVKQGIDWLDRVFLSGDLKVVAAE